MKIALKWGKVPVFTSEIAKASLKPAHWLQANIDSSFAVVEKKPKNRVQGVCKFSVKFLVATRNHNF